MSDSVLPPRQQPTGLPRPWDSPGKNTEVGCHFLRQCMKVKSESEVAQSCPTLSDPMDCSLTGSSVHWIFQARVLEWGAIAFSWQYTQYILKNNTLLMLPFINLGWLNEQIRWHVYVEKEIRKSDIFENWYNIVSENQFWSLKQAF